MLVAYAMCAGVNAEAARVELSGDSSCPSLPAVRTVLDGVLGAAASAREPALRVELYDEDHRYGVRSEGLGREWIDPFRSCHERASTVAVYLALLAGDPLEEPASDAADQQTAPVAPEPRIRFQVPRSKRRRLRVDIDAGPDLLVAVGRDTHGAIAGGVATHVYLGSTHIGGVIGGSVGSPIDFKVRNEPIAMTRGSVDVGIRGGLRHGRLDLSVDLLLALGVELFPTRPSTKPLTPRVSPVATSAALAAGFLNYGAGRTCRSSGREVRVCVAEPMAGEPR